MNPKLLLKIFLTIALFAMVTGCGSGGPPEAPAEVASDDSAPAQAQAPVEDATQAPVAGFTPSSKCIVPDVVGLDIAVAESSLAGAGLQPLKDFRHDESVAENAIISQEPVAGTTLEPCQGDVVIVVSLGAVPVPTETPRPTDIPASPTPIPTETPLPPTPTPYSGPISFASPDEPNVLNPILGWQPGSSEANSYDLTLHPSALTLIAGPDTFPGAPMVVFSHRGDFVAQVKVIVNPNKAYQSAGIVIRPAGAHFNSRNHFPNDWIAISRHLGDTQNVHCKMSEYYMHEYQDELVYFKLETKDSLVSCYYSTNGSNWIAFKKDFVIALPDEVDIFLYTASTRNNEGIIAQFSDFAVSDR